VGLMIALSTEPAAEIETRFVDLILSRPLARHWIITRSTLLPAVGIAVVLSLMLAGTWLGLTWLAPEGAVWPPTRLIALLALNLAALMFCWSGLAALLGSMSRRRAVAGATAGLLALATFFIDYVARVWAPAAYVAWLSPFHYFNPFELVMGKPIPPSHLWILAAIAVISFALAQLVYHKRDV
ncbi:MAG TPA: hypothetical protein VFG76_03835, partial [Candidatus Polarisedimenticolia bacterium]|nr:hypothetical protein [Candidatus Polarisedimenticolia bacterium]